jgi:hypothetical protein
MAAARPNTIHSFAFMGWMWFISIKVHSFGDANQSLFG